MLSHLHGGFTEGDDTSVFTEGETAEIAEMIRTTLGEVLDPQDEPETSPVEFWFEEFPSVVTFCGGCGTVQVQIIGRDVGVVHFAVEVGERLRRVVRVLEDDEFVFNYQRQFLLNEAGATTEHPYLFMSRISYRVALPEQGTVMTMCSEILTVIETLLKTFAAATSAQE